MIDFEVRPSSRPVPAAERAERWRRNGWRTGFTHGWFDPLRPGHVHLLEQARGACDKLVVGLNGDASAHLRGGESPPLQPEAVRAARLDSLVGARGATRPTSITQSDAQVGRAIPCPPFR